jgi:hypothetical protein
VAEAFNGRPPVYHGETISGFCGLCNRKRNVTLRQWFACGPCWNVVLAYQKSEAASKAVHVWWSSNVATMLSNLELKETEPVFYSAYARSSGTKRQRAEALAILDFLVSEVAGQSRRGLFHIEQKTGPASIDEMASFQLDVNDYNDIVGVVRTTGLPAYVMHVRAVREYAFPTSRTIIAGMWWTDIWALGERQLSIQKRRGEDKRAIYYAPDAFKPIETFVGELIERRYEKLLAKLRRSKLPFVE